MIYGWTDPPVRRHPVSLHLRTLCSSVPLTASHRTLDQHCLRRLAGRMCGSVEDSCSIRSVPTGKFMSFTGGGERDKRVGKSQDALWASESERKGRGSVPGSTRCVRIPLVSSAGHAGSILASTRLHPSMVSTPASNQCQSRERTNVLI